MKTVKLWNIITETMRSKTLKQVDVTAALNVFMDLYMFP